MDTLRHTLTVIHVAAGFLSLASALAAATTKIFAVPHRVHVLSGRIFCWGMLGICATAIPLALLGGNLLLLLVAVFSGYLALAGWREAVRPRSTRRWIDRLAPIAMIVAAAVMIGWGALAMRAGGSGGIVLLAFGAIGFFLATADIRRLKRPAEGRERIAQHMIRMMAATISVVTALLVVNVRMDPAWVVWVAPTVVLTPMIAVLARRIRAGRQG